MKIKINKNELLKGLVYCASIIPPKTIIQGLECVHFKIQDKELTMRSTCMDSEVVCKIDIAEDVEVNCLIPCNLLLNTIRLIREEFIQFTFKKKEQNDDYVVQIKTKKGSSKIQSLSVVGFPDSKIEKTEFKEYVTFSGNEGINEIKGALDFVKVEDLRPSLSCLSLVVEGENMQVVGMNGIAGGKLNVKIHNSFELTNKIVIKKNIVDNLFKMTPAPTSKLYINQEMFMVKSGSVTFVGDNYTELKFPEVDHLFQNKGEGYVVINPREVKDSIMRVVNFSEAGDNGFRLVGIDIEDDYSSFKTLSSNYSGSSEEVNEVIRKDVNFPKKEDNALRAKLNSIYLLKILDSTEKNVKVNFFNVEEGPYNKAIHISVEGETADAEYEKQFIIMPSI